MIQQTSLDAFESVVSDVDFGRKQIEVLTLIRSNVNITNQELASKLGWSINRVTPRVNELVKASKVKQDIVRECFCEQCNICRNNDLPLIHRKAIAWSVTV